MGTLTDRLEESPLRPEDLESLARTEQLGTEGDFSAAVFDLKVVRLLALALDSEPQSDLPTSLLNQALERVHEAAQLAEQIQTYSSTTRDSADLRTQILRRVSDLRDWFAINVRPHLLGATGGIEAELLARLQSEVAEAQSARQEIETILGSLRESAGATGASTLSEYYRTQATAHSEAAERWLKALATAFGLLVALTLLLLFFLRPSDDESTVQMIRDIGTRLIVLGAASYAVVFIAKNYRASMHLRFVAEQKRNALDTYPLLQAAAAGEVAKDAITATLVQAIFATGDTGYLDDVTEKTIIESSSGVVGAMLNRKE